MIKGFAPVQDDSDDALKDTDPMPFGKHEGDAMGDVPASYLYYLWDNGMSEEDSPVANYIRKSKGALIDEYPAGDWG